MISIIIVLYNSKFHINNCLDSINKSSFDDLYEIIIVNNNPFDKYSFNENLVKSNNIIYLSKNIGYSKAINKGINKSKGNIILTLNPDVILQKHTIKDMVNILKSNPNIGVVGGKAYGKDMLFQESSLRRFPHFTIMLSRLMNFFNKYFINKYNYCDIDNSIIQNVDSISGSCMLFRKKIFHQLKGFDERFFLYFEDTDFCIRAKKLNYKVTFVPTPYIHIKGGSITNDNYFYVRMQFYLSMIKFVFKYYYEYKMLFIFFILIITIYLI